MNKNCCLHVVAADGVIDLMPLVLNEPYANGTVNKTLYPVLFDSSAANISRILMQRLLRNETANLRLQLALPSTNQTASSFRLNRIPRNGQCKSLFRVDVYPLRHQIVFIFCNGNNSREETFYYDLNLDETTELSFVFANDQLVFYINCSKIYSRYVANDRAFRTNDGDDTLFAAYFLSRGNGITDLRVIRHIFAGLRYCSHQTVHCHVFLGCTSLLRL